MVAAADNGAPYTNTTHGDALLRSNLTESNYYFYEGARNLSLRMSPESPT